MGEDFDLNQIFESIPSELKAILDQLFSDDELEKKTDLTRPINWSVMSVLAEFLRQRGLKRSAGIVEAFVNTSFKYLISKSRKGREEFVEALKRAALETQEGQSQGVG